MDDGAAAAALAHTRAQAQRRGARVRRAPPAACAAHPAAGTSRLATAAVGDTAGAQRKLTMERKIPTGNL